MAEKALPVPFNKFLKGEAPELTAESYAVTVAFVAVAMFVGLEVIAISLRSFKIYRGMYFWSVMVTASGLIVRPIGMVLRIGAGPNILVFRQILLILGLHMILFGQLFILYSRLHLVLRKRWILRAVFLSIVVAFIGLGVGHWIVEALSRAPSTKVAWASKSWAFLKAQRIVLFVQENIIAFLYIWQTVTVLKPNANIRVRRMMWELIGMSAFVIAIDVIWLVFFFQFQTAIFNSVQVLAYAFKLTLEFAILNQLKAAIHLNPNHSSNSDKNNRYRNPKGWFSQRDATAIQSQDGTTPGRSPRSNTTQAEGPGGHRLMSPGSMGDTMQMNTFSNEQGTENTPNSPNAQESRNDGFGTKELKIEHTSEARPKQKSNSSSHDPSENQSFAP
ncbi:MAG: hypothetical protein M1833_000960 [Piccolia ochrophora]|nr:MAG: hypothetical protein M1833_000960 [Piccolia ochrophora]